MIQKMKGINGCGKAILYGTLLAISLLMLGCVVVTWLLHTEKANMDSVGYLVLGNMFLSVAGGAILSIRKAKEKLLLVSVTTGVTIYLVLLMAGIMLFEGNIQGAGETFLMIVGTAIGAALVGSNRKHQTKRGSHPIRSG